MPSIAGILMIETDIADKSLDFSRKYNRQHAEHYLQKHRASLSSRLSHRRDEQLARAALRMAGNPGLVLDLPCGAGRFWPVLAEHPGRVIIGADNSADMLAVAMGAQSATVTARVKPLQTSAFAINLPDNAVDSIFCMRLLHHIGSADDRMRLLREFHRVTRDTVILSLWVDGNYKAWRRKKREARRAARSEPDAYQNRFVLLAAQVESEFHRAGFDVIGVSNFLPLYAMWRVYVLQKRNQ